MKKIKRTNIGGRLSAVACSMMIAIMIIACESLDETFQDFAKKQEIIYIGRPDTVLVAPGYEKLRFWVAINADPKISKGLMESNNKSVIHEFDVVRTRSGEDTISFDLDIAEGEYVFNLFLMDKNGNKSVKREFLAKSYGESYSRGLLNRGIANIEAYATTASINWSEPSPGTITTLLTYEDAGRVLHTVDVPNEEARTVISDYKKGGRITVSSTYKPTENAIEEFEAIPFETNFPEYFLLAKSSITPLRMDFDATDGCHGSSYARLTDGSTDEFWHSCETPEDEYPWVMSFDLGVQANLMRFRLDERAGCCGERSPAAYQIWGSNDLTNAVTANIDAGTMAEWEADAVAKGWVKLLDVSGNDQHTIEVEVPENATSFRYVRIVGISAIDGGLTANFSEFTFWGR